MRVILKRRLILSAEDEDGGDADVCELCLWIVCVYVCEKESTQRQ